MLETMLAVAQGRLPETLRYVLTPLILLMFVQYSTFSLNVWFYSLQRQVSSSQTSAVVAAASATPSTPKKLLGSLLESKSSAAEMARLEEELMTARVAEVDSQAELKEQRMKVMELETNVSAASAAVRELVHMS